MELCQKTSKKDELRNVRPSHSQFLSLVAAWCHSKYRKKLNCCDSNILGAPLEWRRNENAQLKRVDTNYHLIGQNEY